MKLSFFSVLLLAGHLCAAAPMPLPESNDGARHVFSTNQENFLMDGKPVKIISGEMPLSSRAAPALEGQVPAHKGHGHEYRLHLSVLERA